MGVPDILASVNGYFVAVEVKASNGRPSELQLHNINKINETGGFGVVLYPSQFEDFKEMVQCLKNRDKIEAWKIANKINKRWWVNEGIAFKD